MYEYVSMAVEKQSSFQCFSIPHLLFPIEPQTANAVVSHNVQLLVTKTEEYFRYILICCRSNGSNVLYFSSA